MRMLVSLASGRRDGDDTGEVRRGVCFWLLLSVVVIATVVNVLATAVLVNVLQLGLNSDTLQIVGNSIVFGGSVDLGRLLKQNGELSGWDGEGFSILGDGGALNLAVDDICGQLSSIRLSHEGVTIQTPSAVVSTTANRVDGGALYFDTSFPSFGLPTGVRSLRVRSASTGRVTTAVDSSLHLLSGTQLLVHGSEGVRAAGRGISLSADQQLYLKSVNGSVLLIASTPSPDAGSNFVAGSTTATATVTLNVRTMPWTHGRRSEVPGRGSHGMGSRTGATRLCVCAGSGRLFRIPVESGDHHSISAPITCTSVLNGHGSNPCR